MNIFQTPDLKFLGKLNESSVPLSNVVSAVIAKNFMKWCEKLKSFEAVNHCIKNNILICTVLILFIVVNSYMVAPLLHENIIIE